MIKEGSWQGLLQALPRCNRLMVGYSGGLDSHVLLHSLIQTKPEFITLQAIHVHHGLNPKADEWVLHCQQICRDLQIDLQIEHVDAKARTGESPEAAAREARYHAFAKYQHEQYCLVTAHHGDDQVETFLLQLFRGAGVRGLSAMADLNLQPAHWRPLLCFERADLLAYAKTQRLQWIEDDSNQNCDLSRNFLRHTIIPNLKTHWPGLTKTLTRAAHHQQDAESILNLQAEQDNAKIAGAQPNSLSVSQLSQLPRARQLNVLRYWIRSCQLPTAPLVKLQHILSDGLCAAVDKMPLISWPGAQIRRFHDDLIAMPPLSIITNLGPIAWFNPSHPLPLPGDLGILPALPESVPKTGQISVHFPRPGMKIELAGRAGRRDFKKCCQEWLVPPWYRDLLPLIYQDDRLVAVVAFGGQTVLWSLPSWASWLPLKTS